MPRFFFHIHGGGDVIADEEGADLPSLADVHAEARQTVLELLADAEILGTSWTGCWFEIADEVGQVLLTIPFTSALDGGGAA